MGLVEIQEANRIIKESTLKQLLIGLMMLKYKCVEATEENVYQIINGMFPGNDFKAGLIEGLIANNTLNTKDGIISFASEHKKNAYSEFSNYMQGQFDTYWNECSKSKSLERYLDKIYEYNLFMFNVLDSQQLDMVEKILKKGNIENLLDIGCGFGDISSYLSGKVGCSAHGVDLSQKVIEKATERHCSDDKLYFTCCDMNAIDTIDSADKYDAIICIDSLYFAYDLPKSLRDFSKLLSKKGEVIILFSHPVQDQMDKHLLEYKNTALFKAISDLNIQCNVHDFTENSYNFWKRSESLLRGLQNSFEAEGMEWVWENSIFEARRHLTKLKDGTERRYLYHIKFD